MSLQQSPRASPVRASQVAGDVYAELQILIIKASARPVQVTHIDGWYFFSSALIRSSSVV